MLEGHHKRIQHTLSTYSLIPPNSQILIGISGGPDSVYLAFLMYTLGYKISFAHVNYGLRNKDSDKEEALISAYGESWQVPVYIHREHPQEKMQASGQSLQQIARKIRFDFFEKLLESHDLDYCALAHHADDQVESLLMSLIKGNSPRIMHGMPIKRGKYVRPLMGFHKQEILRGLTWQGLEYSHDISNDSNDYIRNKIRNQVVPLLEEINPSVKQNLLEKGQHYAGQLRVLQGLLDSLIQGRETLHTDGSKAFDWTGLAELHGAEVLHSILVHVLGKWGLHGNDLWNAAGLLDSSPGKKIACPGAYVYRERTGLLFLPSQNKEEKEVLISSTEPLARKISYHGWDLEISMVEKADFRKINTHYLDFDKLKFPLRFRPVKQGDKMQVLGMQNKKKLSDIMIDEKWTALQKRDAWVLTDTEHILLLLGFRISEQVKIHSNSQKIVEISYTKS